MDCRAMSQAVSHWLGIMEAIVGSGKSMCGGQCGIGTRFFPSTSAFPSQHRSTISPYLCLNHIPPMLYCNKQ